MSVTNEQLAELLSGIAKAQQAIVEAIERSDGGWRNTHLLPVLNVAANMRQPEPRLVDLPARILLRYQGRAAVDSATIISDLERLFSQPLEVASDNPAAATDPAKATSPAVARFAARMAGAAAARPAAAAAPATAPAAPAGPAMDFTQKS